MVFPFFPFFLERRGKKKREKVTFLSRFTFLTCQNLWGWKIVSQQLSLGHSSERMSSIWPISLSPQEVSIKLEDEGGASGHSYHSLDECLFVVTHSVLWYSSVVHSLHCSGRPHRRYWNLDSGGICHPCPWGIGTSPGWPRTTSSSLSWWPTTPL